MDYSCSSFFSETSFYSLFISFTYKNMRFLIGAGTEYLKMDNIVFLSHFRRVSGKWSKRVISPIPATPFPGRQFFKISDNSKIDNFLLYKSDVSMCFIK